MIADIAILAKLVFGLDITAHFLSSKSLHFIAQANITEEINKMSFFSC